MKSRLLLCVLMVAGSATFAVAARPTSLAAPSVVATVNSQLHAAWDERHLTPAPDVDDAQWLRRVTLDLVGTLPDPQEVRSFLDDTSSDKRSRAVERLLSSPAYAEHWATYWDNVLMGRLTREIFLDRTAFQEWLAEQFASNKSWDKIVRELIVAEGYNSKRPALKGGGELPKDIETRFNPAVNWFLRYSRSLPDLSSATSKVFLGVQIQCAQCHDHKTEKWTQNDFKQFTACFSKTFPSYVDKGRMLGQMVGINRLELKDRLFAPPIDKYEQLFGSYKDYVDPSPKLLDGPELRAFGSRRVQVADWVTSKDNRWFPQAIVNRLWAKLLGRGFVEPFDDFRPGNPPVQGETLEALADDFLVSGYDLKHLLRVITSTEAYQRACLEKGQSAAEHNYWSSYPIKPLDVEELFDSIVAATDARDAFDKLTKSNFTLIRSAFIEQLVSQMGTDDMAEVTELAETIPRSLMLLNGALVCGATRVTDGFGLSELVDAKSDDSAVIESLYLRTLSRKPTAEERKKWLAFVMRPRQVVHTSGPAPSTVQGKAALGVSPEIAKADPDTDFNELLKHAKTGADFTALRSKMKNNADAALYGRAFRAFAAEAPFEALAGFGGGSTPRQQAFEDMYWALVNCTEFLTNH